MHEFSHFKNDEAIMVNIGEKFLTHRRTKAVLFGARFNKRLARKAMSLTHEFIPMAHPLPMSPMDATFKKNGNMVEVEIHCDYKTGLELESLMASTGFMQDLPYLGFAAVTHKEGGKSGIMDRKIETYKKGETSLDKGVWYRVVGKGWLKLTDHGEEKVSDFELEEGDIIICSLQ
ncbi:cyclic pyranopterin monophosphate synthase MoaC [Coprothermobacter platensis]|uniref:cyclic pyranopterin monophosphate synthase MoaC n=1 Tax=Coprothermobacter platensis TaxID=108819 RepID=UPI0003619226|nr:cyclic pyranopterin monophosphate synthase MoaC [Coprothermobacter platensis]